MQVIRDPQKLNSVLKLNRHRKSIGFVPTMGALHAGHLTLMRQATKDNDLVVVSIFVNPAQFGPQEDLNKYPRPFKKDMQLCRKLDVDFVFLPDNKVMYTQDYSTFVNVGGLSDLLCGASRPGHFRGVATVVAKLLNIVQPDILYLGQKDAQQATIIAKMIKDLNFPVQLKVMPIVREDDGLALSSRNIYLNRNERTQAVVLSKALLLAEVLVAHGQSNVVAIINRMKQLIAKKKSVKIDYIAIVDLQRLTPLKKIKQNCLITLAVKIGKTRLIDNTIITYA